MEWTVTQARSHFSEVLRGASEEPQLITSRNRAVAAVVSGETFREFQAWRKRQNRSLYECFEELRCLCADENYELPVRPRANRINSFVEVLDGLAAGHEYP